MKKFYRMQDDETLASHPVIELGANEDPEEWNKKKWGIFWAVNEFNGARKIENLEKVNGWAIDIDTGTKAEMLARLKQGLLPTLVVESKRSLHAYWMAEHASKETWNAIVWDRLVPFYGADAKAKDLARILRVPGFYHWKNPNEPFLIREVFRSETLYTPKQMLLFYPSAQEEFKKTVREIKPTNLDSGLWERIYSLDCEEALSKLCVHPALKSESFTFSENRNGTKQIIVDGKATSSWIDLNKRIGSYEHGGPTIWQWIRWYGHSNKEVYRIVRERFPELWQS